MLVLDFQLSTPGSLLVAAPSALMQGTVGAGMICNARFCVTATPSGACLLRVLAGDVIE